MASTGFTFRVTITGAGKERARLDPPGKVDALGGVTLGEPGTRHYE